MCSSDHVGPCEIEQVSSQPRSQTLGAKIRQKQITGKRRKLNLSSCLKSPLVFESCLSRWLAWLNCVIYYPAMNCGLINVLWIGGVFLRCGSHNKVVFSAGKIVPSLYNFMLELSISVIHGAM